MGKQPKWESSLSENDLEWESESGRPSQSAVQLVRAYPSRFAIKRTDYRIKGTGYCIKGTDNAVQQVRAYPARFAAGAEPQLELAPKWECASLSWAKWDRIRVGRRRGARCKAPLCSCVCLFVCLSVQLFVCSQIPFSFCPRVLCSFAPNPAGIPRGASARRRRVGCCTAPHRDATRAMYDMYSVATDIGHADRQSPTARQRRRTQNC